MSSSWIKICGVTSIVDAELVVAAGADALGLNFWRHSPRVVDKAVALAIIAAVKNKIAVVAVTVDADLSACQEILRTPGVDFLQLHGNEDAQLQSSLGARAYKAVGLAAAEDVRAALFYPGERILVDAKDEARRGGTGMRINAEFAAQVCAARRTIVAGGLNENNVAAVIADCRPWGVDTASGVEKAPRQKDPAKVKNFVSAAGAAFAKLSRRD